MELQSRLNDSKMQLNSVKERLSVEFNIDLDSVLGHTTPEEEAQLALFDDIVGLNYDTKKPIKVRLLVREIHINYMRSLPVHHSQVIHPANENGQHLVDFYLVPNYEFKTQVLKMGTEAVVVSPQTFKKEIIQMLKQTLNSYEENY